MAHMLVIESWIDGHGRVLSPLLKQMGHHYTFVTRNPNHYTNPDGTQHPVLALANTILTTETNNVPDLITFLRPHHAHQPFDGVITICDYYIETVAAVARALELPAAFSSSVELERQKHRMRETLDRGGVPNPAYRITYTWDETRQAASEIGYPLVLKASDLASSAFVRLVQNEAELQSAFGSLAEFPVNFRQQPRQHLYLLEEYMTGDELSVEACTVQGLTAIIGITDKSVTGAPYFIEDGHMFPAALDAGLAEAVHELVRQALVAVGHDHGVSHTEVKLTPKGPRIVEINPRPGGNYIVDLTRYVTGVDLLEALVNLALGLPPRLTVVDTGIRSAAIKMIVPPHGGHIAAVHVADSLAHDPAVVDWQLDPVAGTDVETPIDNACYLGHIIVVDRDGLNARQRVEQVARGIRLEFAALQTN